VTARPTGDEGVDEVVLAGTRADLHGVVAATRARGGRVALVPTMGALHEGHASLLRTARARLDADDLLVASVFVNPLQFGPGEDLDRYPRTLDADLGVCADAGVDVVFAPAVDEVYPGGDPQVTVDPGPLATVLEGAVRPTHFRGVLTVVAKLFGLVQPDLAVFGQKDYQQLTLIRRMVADLCLGIEVVGADTVREPDGLALSSRNRYLSAEERTRALALSAALRAGVAAGGAGPDAVRAAGLAVLADAGVEPDYLEVTDPDLGPPPERGEGRLLVAAKVGTTRLIDNTALALG
jgi:pantoate--beta-alanine ligase